MTNTRAPSCRRPCVARKQTAPLASPSPLPLSATLSMAASSMPFSAESWPIFSPFTACGTRDAPGSEFPDFTTLFVICPDDSTRIELNPQTTAPLPQDGFGMKPVSKSLVRKRERNESERKRILEAAGKRAKEKDSLVAPPQKVKLKGQIHNLI